MIECRYCLRKRGFHRQKNYENHVRQTHPAKYEEYLSAQVDAARQDSGRIRSSQAAARAYEDYESSMHSEAFRAMMATFSQVHIDKSQFSNHIQVEDEFEDDSSASASFSSTNNQSPEPPDIAEDSVTPNPTPTGGHPTGDQHNDQSREDIETPVDPLAGLPAYGPLTMDDMYRDYNMKQPVPPPFKEQSHYNLAEWLIRHQLPKLAINELLHATSTMPIDPGIRESFGSYYTLHAAIKKMQEILDVVEWEEVILQEKWPTSPEPVVLYRRPIRPLVRLLMAQKTYREHMAYAATNRMVVEYDDDGKLKRVPAYKDMHTGDWWKEQQVCKLPATSTAIADIIVGTDSRRRNARTATDHVRCHPPYQPLWRQEVPSRLPFSREYLSRYPWEALLEGHPTHGSPAGGT